MSKYSMSKYTMPKPGIYVFSNTYKNTLTLKLNIDNKKRTETEAEGSNISELHRMLIVRRNQLLATAEAKKIEKKEEVEFLKFRHRCGKISILKKQKKCSYLKIYKLQKNQFAEKILKRINDRKNSIKARNCFKDCITEDIEQYW
jgi:hypothetical protein